MKNNHTLKNSILIIVMLVFMLPDILCNDKKYDKKKTEMVSMGGNSYITSGSARGARIDDNGVSRWVDPSSVISAYFKVNTSGSLQLSLKARAVEGASELSILAAGKKFRVKIKDKEFKDIPIGRVNIVSPGYVRVDISGLNKAGGEFAEISDILVSGSVLSEPMNYVHDFANYWGRRGPSVHLRYFLPEGVDTEWFYNEVTVPEGNDIQGSYYMANGFGEGYFGIQVNSPTERRVLFSVWSPFDTQNPKEIPEEYQIKLLTKGKDVYTGEFGNEGSGGQSYLVYPWKAGLTYKFFTRIHPDGKGNTIYTAWFYAAEESEWRLIASFLRPKTSTYYKSPYSFLENFNPANGYITRKVFFGNQWVRDTQGRWYELVNSRFSYDATAAKQVRVDYAGGSDETGNGRFFLKNCGFFNDNTETGTSFSRPETGRVPEKEFLLIQTK